MANQEPPLPQSPEREAGKPNQSNPLESLLQSFESFVKQVSSVSAEASPKGEHRLLVQATGDILIAQTNKLTTFFRESAKNISHEQRIELHAYLSVQNGEAMAARGVSVLTESLSPIGSSSGGVFAWIAFIMREIKKILHAIFPDLPGWLETIFLLLDEIFNDLLIFLGLATGQDGGKIARSLSQDEVHYLAEMTALASLNKAHKVTTNNQNEE